MNAVIFPRPTRCLFAMLLTLSCLALLASPLLAADASEAASPVVMLQANLIQELVGNRARLIQVSFVCVIFGCALLWWRR